MNILKLNVVLCVKCNSASISKGSEVSGGVTNITLENILVWNSRRAIRIKTAPGRGGYVGQITYRNLTFNNVHVGIVIKTDNNEHLMLDMFLQRIPILRDISFPNICDKGVHVLVSIQGSKEIPVRNVTLKDMNVRITYKNKHIFRCAFVDGWVIRTIFPKPCRNLDQYNEQGE